MQGGWLFYFCPDNFYPQSYLLSAPFIIGALLFIVGMVINIYSDDIIRKLRKDDLDTNYYIPFGGLFKYVNSANYFGEIIEWIGFAILSSSISGWVFVFWTMANIIPRSKAVYEKYEQFYGEEFTKLKRYKIFPFIY
jgi:3-oxo-5-alpha-steroid 4-dehydrogenase 1